MTETKNYSKVHELHYEVREDESILFEDGIIYSAHELDSIKLIKKNLKNQETIDMYIKKIHMMKKHNYQLGIVVKKDVC